MQIKICRLRTDEPVDTGDDFVRVEIELPGGQVFSITPSEDESFLLVSATGRAYQLVVEPQAGNTARIRARR